MQETVNRLKERAAKAQDLYDQGLRKASDLTEVASQKSQEALGAMDRWIHENPWTALGIVAGLGLLLGVLVGQSLTGSDEREAEDAESP